MTWTASSLCGSKCKAKPLCQTAFIKFIDLTCILKTKSQMEWEVKVPIQKSSPGHLSASLNSLVWRQRTLARLFWSLARSYTSFLAKSWSLCCILCKNKTNAKVEGSYCLELDFLPKEVLIVCLPYTASLRGSVLCCSAQRSLFLLRTLWMNCHSFHQYALFGLKMRLNFLDVLRHVSIQSPIFSLCVFLWLKWPQTVLVENRGWGSGGGSGKQGKRNFQ